MVLSLLYPHTICKVDNLADSKKEGRYLYEGLRSTPAKMASLVSGVFSLLSRCRRN